MKRVLLLAALSLGILHAQETFTAYLMPGPFATCQAYFNPALCGVWKAQGKPVTYYLFLSTPNATVSGYSYTITGIVNGQSVIRTAPWVERTGDVTWVQLDFGGIISDLRITANEMGVVGTTASAE